MGKDPPRIHNRLDITQRLEGVALASALIGERSGLDVNLARITCTNLIDQPLEAFNRQQVSTVHTIAEEDPGIKLGNDDPDSGLGYRQRSVLPRRTATEIPTRDDHGVVAFGLAILNKAHVAVRQARSYPRSYD